MAYGRHHSHLRYATPSSAALPASRAGRWRAPDLPVMRQEMGRRSAASASRAMKGLMVAAPISLALWAVIGLAVRFVI
jgi:hypothetical protein